MTAPATQMACLAAVRAHAEDCGHLGAQLPRCKALQ